MWKPKVMECESVILRTVQCSCKSPGPFDGSADNGTQRYFPGISYAQKQTPADHQQQHNQQ